MTLRISMIVVLWSVFGLLLAAGLTGNWGKAWSVTGINPLDQPFGDVIAIPQAVKLAKEGIDPYTDVGGVRLYYPRIWLPIFDVTGLSNHVVGYALGVIAVYLLCLSHLIFTTRSNWSALLVLVGGLSSASLLAVERGNNDLVTFSLAYLAAWPTLAETGAAVLVVGAALKLYPAAGLVGRAMAEPVGGKLKVYVAALAAIGVYALTQWPDIVKIQRNYPHLFRQSYGVSSLAAGVDGIWHIQIRVTLIVVAVALLVAAVLIGRRQAAQTPSDPLDLGTQATRRFYAVFVSIFLLTFLLTPNYEYRLIFLIPLFPFYVDLLADRACRKWAAAAILLALLSIDNRIVHDSQILKATAHAARVLLFGVNGVVLGLTLSAWTFGRRKMDSPRAQGAVVGVGA